MNVKFVFMLLFYAMLLFYYTAAAADPLPPPVIRWKPVQQPPAHLFGLHLAQDALIAKARETIRGWRGKLEALVAEHEALAGDVGPAAALSPQSPKARRPACAPRRPACPVGALPLREPPGLRGRLH